MGEITQPVSVAVNVAGTDHQMPVTFRALQALSQAGIDPLQIALRVTSGQPALTLEDVVKVVHAGVTLAGGTHTLDQVGQHVLSSGAVPYLTLATQYLAAFLAGGPARKNASAPNQVPQQ